METLNKETIFKSLAMRKKELHSLGVKRLGLFGSYARQEERPESDIDFLVDFERGKKNADNFMNLAFFLEDTFHKKIELVTNKSLSPYFKPYILKDVQYFEICPF